MDKLQILKDKYYNLMVQAWNDNKDILIESFVEYYGEEYCDLIIKRISEIVFMYYTPIPELSFLDFIISNMKEDNRIRNYVEYRDIFIQDEKVVDNDKKIVGVLSNNKVDKDSIINLDKALARYCCSFIAGSINDSLNRFIFVPIFVVNDRSIVHEVNHAITYHALMKVIDDKGRVINDVSKLGVVSDVIKKNIDTNETEVKASNEIILEELLNEKASLEITDIFHKKGGKLFYFDTLTLQSSYYSNLYLVDDFYSAFKELLKVSRITENKKLLIDKIGKQNFQELVNLVNECYSTGITIEDQQDKIVENKKRYPEILAVIEKMKEYYQKDYDLSDQELLSYYQELEKEGHIVVPLNDKKTK